MRFLGIWYNVITRTDLPIYPTRHFVNERTNWVELLGCQDQYYKCWTVLSSKLSSGCLQCLLVLMCLTVCCGLWSPLTVVEELLMMVNNNYSCKMYDNWASKPCTVKVKTLRGSWGTPRGTMAGWWVTILMQQEERRGEGGEPQNM